MAGLVLVFFVLGSSCFGQQVQPRRGAVRTYFIAADRVDWDYTPRGRNLTGVPVQEGAEDPASNTPHRIYPKAIYREYTDATFKTLKARPPQWEHLGILGPLIRAEVGDTIRVVFRNNTKLSCTMHPHGLEYAKASEGALYSDGDSTGKAGDMVRPGETYTYMWYVPERAGPGPMDGSSVLWMYHSHFVESKDMNTGLLGPIIVTARGASRSDGSPKGVDREFVLAFAIFDETDSWYFDAWSTHVEHSGRMKSSNPLFRDKHLLYSINGYTEGNLPLLTMKKGERIRWYLLSNSNEEDVHMVHWHGETVIYNQMRTDTVPLQPMSMAIADMVPDNVGLWLLHCHVNDHFVGGMQALFRVEP